MYIIKDWAGNILDFKGTFKLPQLVVAMEFSSFDDGWDWILEYIDEDSFGDVFVVPQD